MEPRLGAVQVRTCQPEDFPVVLKLLAQLWPDQHMDPGRIRFVFDHALASDRQIYFWSSRQDQVIGFGSLTIKNNL